MMNYHSLFIYSGGDGRGTCKSFKNTFKSQKNCALFHTFHSIQWAGLQSLPAGPAPRGLCFTPLLRVIEENTYSTQSVSTQLQSIALYLEKVE